MNRIIIGFCGPMRVGKTTASRYLQVRYGDVCFDDVRVENEAAFLRSNGGFIVRLVRETGIVDDHESERVPVQGDYVIDNNGDLQYLYTQLDGVIRDIQQKRRRMAGGTQVSTFQSRSV